MGAKLIDDLDRIEGLQAGPIFQVPPGMFEIQYATLHFHRPANEQPIGEFIKRIYLSESMTSFGVTGWIELQDTWNLVRNGIILGQELLYLKFRTPESNLPVDFTKTPLAVYKVEDMQELQSASGSLTQSALTYKLHVCSPELLRNDRIRISETMQGTNSSLVSHILKKHLKTQKEIVVEETDELLHYVMPNIHPFQAIQQHLMNSAQGVRKNTGQGRQDVHGAGSTSNSVFKGNKVTDFYFYETTKGYRFKSLQEIFNYDMIFTIGSTPGSAGYRREMTTSTQHEYVTPADTLRNTLQGTWGMRHIRHSASTKSFSMTDSNYHRSLNNDRYSYVSETPVYSLNNIPDTNIRGEDARISDYPESRVIFDSSASKQNSSIIKNDELVTYPWSVPGPDRALQRVMQTEHLMNYQLLNVRLHGISGLEAGMVLYLLLPDIGEGSGYLGGEEAWENRMNNLWIIKDLTHTIFTTANKPAYWCDLTLSNMMRMPGRHLPKFSGTGSFKFGNPGR